MEQFSAIVTIFFFLFSCTQCNTQKAKSPERPANVPDGTQWMGGIDGGNWYQIKKVLSNNTFEIRIYNENSGQVEADTTFVLNPDCTVKSIDSITLVRSINGYDGEKILLHLPEEGKKCFLKQL